MWSSSPQCDSWKLNCCGLAGSQLSTGNSNLAFLTIGKISSQKASFVCVKNNGSSGAEQLLPSQSACRHHEQVLCENTLFSKSANNSCCLGLNLLRVCRYKVLLCNARRFLQLSVVWPILWQNPHVMDVCEDTPDSLFGGVLGFPLPLLPYCKVFPLPLG